MPARIDSLPQYMPSKARTVAALSMCASKTVWSCGQLCISLLWLSCVCTHHIPLQHGLPPEGWEMLDTSLLLGTLHEDGEWTIIATCNPGLKDYILPKPWPPQFWLDMIFLLLSQQLSWVQFPQGRICSISPQKSGVHGQRVRHSSSSEVFPCTLHVCFLPIQVHWHQTS